MPATCIDLALVCNGLMECPNGEEEVPFDDKYLKIILKILKYLKILNVKNIQKYDLMECPNGEEEVSLNI